MNQRILRRVLHAALLLSCAALLVAAARFASSRIDYRQESNYNHDIRSLQIRDAELDEQVLTTRCYLSAHYDQLVQQVKDINRLQGNLKNVPAFLGQLAISDLKARLDQHQTAFAGKQQAIERFKTNNAVLKNSLHYFPRAAASVGNEERLPVAISSAVHTSLSALLSLEVMPTRETLAQFDQTIATLQRVSSRPQLIDQKQSLDVLIRHAWVVSEFQPLVDELVRQIVASSTSSIAASLSVAYTSHYNEALDRANTAQKVLVGLTGVIVTLGLLEIIHRLQRHSDALARATRELSDVNAALGQEREREKELNELKSQFVSMTSHEFRTPLAAIISSSELLEKYAARWEGERIGSHLGRIKTAARHMTHMLEDMLVIGRADAGMLRSTPAPFNLQEYCRQQAEAVVHNSGGKNGFDYRFEGEPIVQLDERLLTHIVSNLLENACKYSPFGSEVHLRVRSDSEQCLVEVNDQGIGIPPEDLPRIFLGFHRGGNVGSIPGTGLGLAVVKRVVDVLGGTISVDCAPNDGTTFAVRLPIAQSATGLQGEVRS